MHELSIAQSILNSIMQNVDEPLLKKVKSIQLEIGKLSGIDIDALTFSFDILKEQAPFSKAKLIINEIEANARCTKCNWVFNYSSFGLPCPACGGYELEILSGKEMRIKSIQLI